MRALTLQNKLGRIACQFRVNGVRYSLLGLGNWESGNDKAKAHHLLRVIEGDILEGKFDTTLAKYKQGSSKALNSLGTPSEEFSKWVIELTPNDRNYAVHYEPVLKGLLSKSCNGYGFTFWVEHWKHLASRTYNDRLGVLQRFGEWLVKERGMVANPYEKMRRKPVEVKQISPFTAQQVHAIVTTIEARNPMAAAYYEFLFLTGCRPSEAIGLLQGKASIAGQVITIDSVLARGSDSQASSGYRVRKGTKTGDVRLLPISTEIRRVLIKALEATGKQWDENALVFQNLKGEALDDTNLCDRYWKPALQACGIPYQRPYVTRHTAASTLIENGCTLADAAKLLGHKDLRMVSTVYGHAIKPLTLPTYS